MLVSFTQVTNFEIVFDQLSMFNIFEQSSHLNPVQWSLVYEVYFYLLIGAALIILPNLFDQFKVILIVILGSFLAPVFLDNDYSTARFAAFFVGVLVSKMYCEGKVGHISLGENNKLVPVLLLCGILLLPYLWGNDLLPFDDRAHYFIAAIIVFSLLLVGLLNGNRLLEKFFSFYPLRVLGAISFSFYMVHTLITISWSRQLLDRVTLESLHIDELSFTYVFAHYCLSFVLSFVVSLFLFYFLEKPYFNKKTQ
jgi:peptidoglycan/LPS O-acetylase OafA/YrhL